MSSSVSSVNPHDGGFNLKGKQTQVVSRLLRLSTSREESDSALAVASNDAASTWKLLIYDRYCQDILSPLLTVNELRSLGITLHMSLFAPRERVPDVPAVYFVRPTEENLQLIAKDVRAGIYDSTYINFCSSVPSALLESFAAAILKEPLPSSALSSANPANPLQSTAAAASRIVRIMDQYCEFISLEDRLFTLNCLDSYARLNGDSEAAMFAHVEEIVSSLFSVIVTSGVVPIIRAKVGHAAELVASKLDTKLREHLSSRNNLFSGAASSSFHRPLLILTDRNIDLAAPLLHSWTYQALLHDLMHMSSNRVTVTVAEPSPTGAAPSNAKPKPKTYDLLSSEDKFWKHHAGKAFPKVAEGVTERLQAYQTEFNNVTKKAGAAAGAVNGGAVAVGTGSDDLSAAINALPKLQKRKKLLDTHMNIATALLKEIKTREIDVFFDVEQSILQKSSLDKNIIAAIFGGAPAAAVQGAAADATNGKGGFLDRLRFLLIYFLNTALTEEQLNGYKALLKEAAARPAPGATEGDPTQQSLEREIAAIDYVQQFKFMNRLSGGDDFGSGGSASSAQHKPASSSGAGGMLGKLADSLYGGSVGLLAGVRNLLPTNNHLPLTRLVEQLMLNKENNDTLDAQYKYFDPKAPASGARNNRATRVQGAFKEGVVFVLGGGNYSEYQNLQDWQRENHTTHGISSVVYGCTEMVSPETFIRQLANMQLATQQASKAHLPVD